MENTQNKLILDKKIKTLLVDRDGTLLGTCSANFTAYAAAISKHNLDVNLKMIDGFHSGLNWIDIAKIYYPSMESTVSKSIQMLKRKIFSNYFHLINPNFKLITEINYFDFWIVTNSTMTSTLEILNFLKINMDSNKVYGSELGFAPKPSPEIYLHVVASNDLDLSKTLVVEDSEAGLSSARKAGLNVVKTHHIC
jgi:HAD superfamily hydrolase (TIGR01509 family)